MFRFFRKHETNEEIKVRLLELCEKGDYGICPRPMKAEIAVNELRDFFLGKDWYSSFPEKNKPSISETVYYIKNRKSKKLDRATALPSMTANAAIDELCDYFLGKDWYVSLPLGREQVIAEIVYQIERRYIGSKAD